MKEICIHIYRPDIITAEEVFIIISYILNEDTVIN